MNSPMAELSKIDQIKEVLVGLFSPLRIFAYGSQIKGKASEQSDYDFVVVVKKTDLSRWDSHELAKREILQKFNCVADVWVYTEGDFNDWKDDFSSIPEIALNTGLELPLG